MQPHTFEKLGGNPRPIDERDFHELPLPEGGVSTDPTPTVFMQESAWSTFVHYQGKEPACGAHALAGAKQILNANSGTISLKKTPRLSWVDIKQKGSDTNPLNGTDMRSLLSSGKNTGVNDFEPLENDVTYDPADYAAPKFITQAMLSNAGFDKLDSYTFTNGPYTFQRIKDLVYQNKVVIALIQVGNSFWTAPNGQTSWAESDICPIRPPSPIVDGHFIVFHSFDENYIYFLNSFGPTWGRKGHGYIGPHYPPYVLELGFPKNLPATTPQPTAIQTVQATIPKVQNAINVLSTLPQEQKEQHIGIIQELLNDLSLLLGGHN